VKALVTGAGGLIGTELCRRLLDRGDEVRGLFLPNEPDRGLEEMGGEIRRGDITWPESLRGLCDGCGKVFHLAARVEEWGWRSQFRETHYDGTKHLLRECAGKAERFIYFSSIAYYGSTGHARGYTEDAVPVPTVLPYATMKMLCEKLVRTYQVERGLPYTIIRPANVIGERSAHLRNVLDSFSRGPVPLVEGGSYSASFVYVENLVDGVLLAADSDRAINRPYHFCDDYEVTWGEYLTRVGALLGKKPWISLSFRQAYWLSTLVEYLFLPFNRRPPFSRHAVHIIGHDNHVDCTRAKEELGWRTRVSWDEVWSRMERYIREEYLKSEVSPR